MQCNRSLACSGGLHAALLLARTRECVTNRREVPPCDARTIESTIRGRQTCASTSTTSRDQPIRYRPATRDTVQYRSTPIREDTHGPFHPPAAPPPSRLGRNAESSHTITVAQRAHRNHHKYLLKVGDIETGESVSGREGARSEEAVLEEVARSERGRVAVAEKRGSGDAQRRHATA